MDNQLATLSQVTTEIIDNANQFTDFLSSETVTPIRKSISLIPNIIGDILNVALENKKLNIQNTQFKQKTNIIYDCLELQDKNLQRQFQIQLEKIHVDAEAKIAEEKQKCNVRLKEIKANEKTQLRKIKSDERIKVAEIRSQYELTRQKQEQNKELFLKALHTSNLRFNRKMKNVEKIQSELSFLIKAIMNKITHGNASNYEYKLLEQLTELKIRALEKDFDISEGFLDMFMERAE